MKFGPHIRRRREALRAADPRFSVRQLAGRIGVEPSYLSKVERDLEGPPSEPRIQALANELGEDPDALLALAGKVASDLQDAIRQRPRLFSRVIRDLQPLPDDEVLRLADLARSGSLPEEDR